MRHVQDNAEECVRRVIGVLKDGEFACEMDNGCLLYTSDAADERSSVDLGGRRIIKKKKRLTPRVRRSQRLMKVQPRAGNIGQ